MRNAAQNPKLWRMHRPIIAEITVLWQPAINPSTQKSSRTNAQRHLDHRQPHYANSPLQPFHHFHSLRLFFQLFILPQLRSTAGTIVSRMTTITATALSTLPDLELSSMSPSPTDPYALQARLIP